VDWALQALPIANVQLLTDPDNEPSKRVAMACGFEPRGMSDGRNLFVRDRPGDVED
jgi:RimJ/RimL family protein N-acetyltransferase